MLEEVRKHERTRRLPVIILTTSRRDDEIARGYELGANSYIVKPVKFEEFRAKIIDLKMYWVLTSELPNSQEEELKGQPPIINDRVDRMKTDTQKGASG